MREARSEAGSDEDSWESAQHERELAVIWPLLGRHIAFHRTLVDLTSSVKAALLLSQTIYWTRHGRDIAKNGGWFVKTTEQWEMETGLSVKEQASAREVLRDLALVSEERVGIPARLHFRLCAERLGELLCDRIGKAAAVLDWDDGVVLAQLLGPALAYHRTLAGIAGGVNAGLLLSRALNLTRFRSKRPSREWICNSAMQWVREIGLTRREQERAREDLARAGLWEEALVGIPPRLVARVRLHALLALLAGDRRATGDRGLDACCADGGVPAGRIAPNGESRRRESHLLVLPKAPNQIHQNRHHSLDKSAKLLIQRSTSCLVQPLYAERESRGPDGSQSGGDLVFPEGLLAEERAAALRLVQRCADQAQALLDELGARLRAKAVRTSPIAYLRGLVARAIAGEFIPELGLRIAADRRRSAEQARLRDEREAEKRRLAAERATPEYRAKAAERHAQIQQLVESMLPRRRRGGRS